MAKKKAEEKHKCIDCCVGELIQWDNNPVIVNCRHLETKDVANIPRECPHYKLGKNEIRHLTHFK